MIKDNDTAHSMTKDAMLLVFIAIIGLALLTSCATQNRFGNIADNHPDWLAEECKEKFPIDTTTKTNTTYIKADNTDWTNYIDSLNKVAEKARNERIHDTIYSEKDCNDLLRKKQSTINNLSASLTKLSSGYKKCKPDTAFINTTYTVKDNRELFLAQKELKEATDKVESRTKQRNTWMIIALIALGVHLVRFLIKR